MPITIPTELRHVSQEEFGKTALRVMNVVFAVHQELGRFLEEDIYQREIAYRLSGAESEVPITVSFDHFSKTYFLDLLVEGSAPFEFKAVDTLAGRHRAQLVNYLLLAELSHGKLVNLRPDSVEHEFVNATLARTDRAKFEVLAADWQPVGGRDIQSWLAGAVRDWGTGLDVHLYEDAVIGFFGGEDLVVGETEIKLAGRRIGIQPVRLAAPGVAFKVTTIAPGSLLAIEAQAQRFLGHSSLTAILWMNITRGQLLFKTIL